MTRFILLLFFISNTLFSEPQPYHFINGFNKIFIYWEEKIYESKVPVFTSSIKYDREADAYECKINVKKMKLVNKDISIYKDKWNEVVLSTDGSLKFYYKGKEILNN